MSSLQQSILEIKLGDLSIRGTSVTASTYPNGLNLEELTGWFDPGTPEDSFVDSALTHGGRWSKPARIGVKTATIKGWAWFDSRTEADAMKRQLAALVAQDSVSMAVQSELNVTWRTVRVMNVEIPDEFEMNPLSWTIDVQAPDPRRYGDVETRAVDFNETTRLYNIITNPRPSLTSHWFTSTFGGESKPARAGGGYVCGHSAGTDNRVSVYYRGPLSRPINQVRLQVSASLRVRARLSVTWLDAAGVALRTDAFPDAEVSSEWLTMAAPVSPPTGAVEFTLGADTFGQSSSAGYELRCRRAMAGIIDDGPTLFWPGGETQMARMAGEVADGDSRSGRVAMAIHRDTVGTSVAFGLRASRAGVWVSPAVTWLDVRGGAIEQTTFQAVEIGPTWVQATAMLVPPKRAMSMSIAVDAINQTNGDIAVSFEPFTLSVKGLATGSSAAEYADGDTSAWRWVGQRNNSVSEQLGPQWVLDNRDGTAPSIPSISFVPDGAISGFRLIFAKGVELRWNGAIAARSKVQLIPDEHAVLVNGQLARAIARGSWPSVEPGQSLVLALVPTESVTFSAQCSWAPAWW
ncbi:hypothetical protein [Propionibacterium freudenreichii]|uniref:hypothetical protein n=1 Tax=Propionibacterium freudenreichii TaxID=1744 RepID=UPI000543BB29|nr:hypothetical protein [Propionibacterium freudenreichii]CEG98127.1 Putative uncharacterized protein [Propionibacterium freudenreichii]